MKMDPITWGIVGLVVGIVATLGVQRAFDDGDDADVVAASGEVVNATGDAVEGGITAGGDAAEKTITASQQVEMEKARAQTAIATMPAASIGAQAVVDLDCAPATLAHATYAVAVAASQGKEGSASVNAEEAQQDVSRVIAAMVDDGLCADAVNVEAADEPHTVDP